MEIVELTSDPWLWVFFENAKSHIIHQDFFPDLVADMANRDMVYSGHVSAGTVLMDAPGPIFIGRPVETINIDGLSVQVPAEDFGYIMDLVTESLPRKFHGGLVYFKIHVWNNAVVLNERQRDRLLEELEARWERAYTEGERFYNDKIKNS